VNDASGRLEIESSKSPMAYREAAQRAGRSARADSDSYRRRIVFRPRGTPIGED